MSAEPVAIIGMSCRAPGVETLHDLWRMLVAGEARFQPVRPGRWYGFRSPDDSPARAALIDDVGDFDARFFGIAPRMAAWMDPQHRMLLELAWHAVENSGRNPDDLHDQPVAVLVGGFLTEYRDRMIARGKANSAAFPGTLNAFLANRLSYQFSWTGPSLVIDTACSSGLTALTLAVQGLRAGEYPMALVAASNVTSAGFYATVAQQGEALSRSGVSVPFSAGRDGYLRGEGGACVLLKPLTAARADGDPIHAVIRATGSAHNARGGGLTGTDSESMARLIARTAATAGLHLSDVGFIEAHGTATPSGDAAEIGALAAAFDAPHPGPVPAAGPAGRLWVGSIKSNIGHLEGASGLIGLVKAALVLQHGHIPPVAGLTSADDRLPVASAPIAVATESVSWPRAGSPRYVGVNSFGLGGSMSHVLLEEAPPRTTDTGQTVAGIAGVIPLSASTPDGVARLGERLLRHLTDAPDVSVPSLAWTMQTGRRAQSSRAVVAGSTLQDVLDALRSLVAASGSPPGGDQPSPHLGRLPAVQRNSVDGWLRGGDLHWRSLWDSTTCRAALALPGSSFDRRPYWFE